MKQAFTVCSLLPTAYSVHAGIDINNREEIMSKVFSTDFAGRKISLKTDYVAGQADGAVLATYGDTVVLVTAVSLKAKIGRASWWGRVYI